MCTKSYGMKGLSEVWSGSETPLIRPSGAEHRGAGTMCIRNDVYTVIIPKSRNITINRFQVAGTSSVLSLS